MSEFGSIQEITLTRGVASGSNSTTTQTRASSTRGSAPPGRGARVDNSWSMLSNEGVNNTIYPILFNPYLETMDFDTLPIPSEPPVLKRANCQCTDCGREKRCTDGSYPRPPTQHDVWCECESYPDEVAIVTESTFPWESTVSSVPSHVPPLKLPGLNRANCGCSVCGCEKRCTDGSYPRSPTASDVWCKCTDYSDELLNSFGSIPIVSLLHLPTLSSLRLPLEPRVIE